MDEEQKSSMLMARTLVAARNPIWFTADHQILLIEVTFEELPNDPFMPFSCSATDASPWGVDIFHRAVASEFGEIAGYVPPPPTPYVLSVSDMWDRMTEVEGDDFDTATLVASPLKSRKAFQTAITLQSDSELFAWVKNVLKGVTSSARADAIMAQ